MQDTTIRHENIKVAMRGLNKDMKHKLHLQENMLKNDWRDISIHYLLFRLKDELAELESALINQDMAGAKLECADIANFTMMIHDKLCILRGE